MPVWLGLTSGTHLAIQALELLFKGIVIALDEIDSNQKEMTLD